MDLTYRRFCQLHFQNGLKGLFKGLDKTAIVLCCMFGPALLLLIVGLLVAMANGLVTLTDPRSLMWERICTVAGWQTVTFSLLWALRNLLFMTKAKPFFASLPISTKTMFRADLVIAMQCYSFLWLPLA